MFSSDRESLPVIECEAVKILIHHIKLKRPRQWGGCWLFCYLWDLLELDNFWAHRLGLSRKGTCWLNVLKTLVCYRMLDPGSEFRLHRLWFDGCAVADLLGEGVSLGAKNTLYRCLDHLEAHREELFVFLRKRWEQLFQTDYEVLLYDLTSTYFESDPPTNPSKKTFWVQQRQTF